MNEEKKKLTPKQEKQYRTFAQEYLINNFNGTKAAIKAGYSEKTASSQASRLLSHAKVQEYIEEYGKEREKRTEVTGDMVIKELAKMAFADIRDLYDEGRLLLPHELDDKVAASISSFKTRREGDPEEGFYEVEEYKRHSKEKALELLGRHFALFTDKSQVEHSGTVVKRVINVNPTKEDK